MIEWGIAFLLAADLASLGDGAPVQTAQTTEAICRQLAQDIGHGGKFVTTFAGKDAEAVFEYCLKVEDGVVVETFPDEDATRQ